MARSDPGFEREDFMISGAALEAESENYQSIVLICRSGARNEGSMKQARGSLPIEENHSSTSMSRIGDLVLVRVDLVVIKNRYWGEF